MSIGPQLRRRGAEGQRDVLAHRALHQQGLGAVAGHEAMPARDRVGGMAELRPAGRRPRSCRRAAGSSRTARRTARPGPGPRARRRRATSPLREVERDVLQLGADAQGCGRRAAAAACAAAARLARLARCARAFSIARAEHQLDDPLLDARLDVDDADGLAVAQHRGAVAERRDLDEAVRDEDDRAAGLALAADDVEHALGEVGGQRRGHLVEQQHVGLDRRARGRGRARAGRRAGCRARCRGGRDRECRARAPSPGTARPACSVRRRFAATSRSGISDGSW